MQDLYVNVWDWLRSRFASAIGRNPRRCRQQRTSPYTALSAYVEQLESRELLSYTYHGGALIPNVQAQAIYLGSDWTTKHGLNVQGGNLDQFISTMVASKYVDGLTLAGYNVFRGTSTKGVFDNVTLNKSFDGFTGGITDGQIRNNIQGLITAKQVQQPNANTLYVVFVEPGVLVTGADGFSTSNNTFLGYHGGFAGTAASGAALNIHYAVIAYPTFPTAPGFSTTTFNDLTITASEEMAEAMTDPDVQLAIDTGNSTFLGWNDDATGAEIEDLSPNNLTVFKGYEVREYLAPNFELVSPNGVIQGLVAPQNLKLKNISPTTALLSWDPVALAQTYKIFSVNGSTRSLLGSVNAPTTSFKLTGLTTGTSRSFLVEAVDGTFVVDSKPVSGIVPFSKSLIQNGAGVASPAGSSGSSASALVHTPVIPPAPDRLPVEATLLQWFDGSEAHRLRSRV